MTQRTVPPTIIVGYACSAASRRALTTAADLARDLGARLHVVHVIDLGDYPVDPDLPDWEAEGAERLEAEGVEVARMLADWPMVEWQYDLQRGDPARAIADVAGHERARMIVVGTRGSSGFGAVLERLLGASRSVAHALERAEVPVLVVPSHRSKPDRRRTP